ncbi:MAG: hypothetical protein GY838_17185 [bacterium]|nr:hypothetical protein [bacterium]
MAASAQEFPDELMLALEVSGELEAPPALVTQIGLDLAAIKAAYPVVADIHVFPRWEPGYLFVGVTEDALADWHAGTYAEMDSLNAEYGPVTVETWSIIDALGIRFATPYHPEVLADIYETIPGVRYANPSSPRGDGSDIFSPGLPLYTAMYGEGDCLSGCTYEEFWEFSVVGGSVVLLDHYIGGVTNVDDGPAAAVTLREIAPNPFNPVATIRYYVGQAGPVRLLVHDIRGRLVAELFDGHKTAGDHVAVWRGRDESGRTVPSGVYSCRLVAGGESVTHTMTLLK